MGSLSFFACCLKILFLTAALQLATYHSVARCVSRSLLRNTSSTGFSSVLLGLLTLNAFQAKTVEFILFPGFPIDSEHAPLLAYLCASCLLTDASVVGHFSAMVAGWLLGSGVFLWLTEYWFGSLLLWCIGSIVVSLKKTTRFGARMSFVKCERWPPWRIDADEIVTTSPNSVDDSMFVFRVAMERVLRTEVRTEDDSAQNLAARSTVEEPIGGQQKEKEGMRRVDDEEIEKKTEKERSERMEKKEHFRKRHFDNDVEAQHAEGGERKKGSRKTAVYDSDDTTDDFSFFDDEFDENNRLL